MAKTFTVDFYQDPGHGWVRVAKSKLVQLGIADKISVYSYERKGHAYLEEDCDLATLITALKDRGVEIKYREFHTNKSSKIRSYNNYVG
jgi:hypothetical protein